MTRKPPTHLRCCRAESPKAGMPAEEGAAWPRRRRRGAETGQNPKSQVPNNERAPNPEAKNQNAPDPMANR